MSILSAFPAPFLEGTSKQFEATLLASGWTKPEGEDYFIQIINVIGVTANSNGDLGLSQKASLDARNAARAAHLIVTDQGANTITIVADGSKPEVDIPIIVTIFPKGASAGDEIIALDTVNEHITDTNNPHQVRELPIFDPVADEGKVLAIVKGVPSWVKVGLDTDNDGYLDIALEGGN